ncbi:MAG: type I glyceraldehyde-3-phosphate dehydrogenase [Deltaproteobacteria bacterium]|nr:type I glyceraldehyde-3-phosphate dehydrogenase [Deltaproteobacteria bacterium]
MARIAINGFGRIGRCVFRELHKDPEIEVVQINDLTDASMLAHLLKYDSVHGRYSEEVTSEEGAIIVGGKRYEVSAERDPTKLPWGEKEVDLVLECTGIFRSRQKAGFHLEAGAKRVLISAPADDPDATFVYGINHESFDPEKHKLISNASCTTNCLSPVAKVLHEKFGIVDAMMTTIHSYTNDQSLLDLPHKDKRRARAAAVSMVPTSTGAARAVALVLPELKGKINGMAVRVPTPNVSVVDLVARVERVPESPEVVNAALREAAAGPLKGVLDVCDELAVSIDFNGNPHSSIVDADSTSITGGLVKVLAWYDNEWGFSMRMIDMTKWLTRG